MGPGPLVIETTLGHKERKNKIVDTRFWLVLGFVRKLVFIDSGESPIYTRIWGVSGQASVYNRRLWREKMPVWTFFGHTYDF